MYKCILIFAALGLIGLGSCKVKKEANQQESEKVTVNKNKGADRCETEGVDIVWSAFTSNIDFDGGNAPLAYKAYACDPAVIDQHFSNRKNDGTNFKLALPVYIDENEQCVLFNIAFSSTMSPELQKKYGGVMTFKGQAVTNAMHTIRAEYSKDVGLRAYINIEDKVILFMPIQSGGETIYICYDKEKAGDLKLPFEK